MAAFNKFNQFAQDEGRGVHNLNSNTLKVMLTNVAPVATNAVKADITDISAGNGYTAGGAAIGSTAYSQTGGVATLTGADVVFTASGGTIGPFRYAVVYNDTPSSPAKPLIGWFDNGASQSIPDGGTFTVSFPAGILTET